MKHILLACLGVLALTGCATSVGDADLDGGETDGPKADAPTNKDSGNKDGSQGGQCVSSCTSDEDCQNSCPNVPNGINCCDTSTGICYAYSSQQCPEPVADGGTD